MAITATTEFQVKITADTTRARDEFGRFIASNKGVTDSVDKTRDSLGRFVSSGSGAGTASTKLSAGFAGLSLEMLGVNEAIELGKKAWEKIKEPMEAVLDAFREQEAALRGFNMAMQYSGNYTEKSSETLRSYAEELQKLTGFDHNATLGLMARAKAMGLTDEQTKMALEATANQSARSGEAMGATFDKVIGTIHGVTSGLEDTVPALRHMNIEALAAGKGFEAIAKQSAGAAAEGGKTWEAYTARAAAAKKDILAAIGEVIDKGIGLTELAKSSAEFWEMAAAKIEKFKSTGIAAIQAIKEGFAAVDWKGIGEQMKVMAEVLAVAFGPALIGALASAAAAAAGFAATWIALPVGIMATVLALDLVIKNLQRLPELAGMFRDILERAFLNLTTGFEVMLLAITQGLTGLAKMIPGGDKMFSGMISGMDKFQQGLAEEIDSDQARFAKLGTTIDKTFSGLDQGLTGKLLTELKGMGSTMDTVFAKVKKAQDAASFKGSNKGAPVTVEDPRLKEQMALAERTFRQFLMAGKQAQIESAKIGLTEAEAVQAEFEVLTKNASEAYATIVKFHGVSTVEAERYHTALTAMEKAKNDKILLLNKQAAHDGGALWGAQLDNVTESTTRQLEDTTKALDEAARRDLVHWDMYQRAKVAAAEKAAQQIEENASLGEKLGNAVQAVGNVKTEDFSNTAAAAAEAASAGTIHEFLAAGQKMTDSAKPLTKAIDSVWSVFKGAVVEAIGDFIAASDVLVNEVLNGKWIQQMADMFNMLADLPTTLLRAFQDLSAVLTKIVTSLPQLLSNFLKQLPLLMSKIIEMLPKAMQMIGAMLPKLAQALADAAPAFVDAIMKGLPAIIDGLTQAFMTLIDALPDIFRNFLKALPEVIMHFIAGIGAIVTDIIKNIPAIVEDIADNIGPIVEAVVQGLLDAMPSIIAALTNPQLWIKVGVALAKAVANAIVGAIQGLLRGVADMLSGKGFNFKMPEVKMPDPTTGIKKTIEALKGSSSALFRVEDFKTAAKAIDIGDQIRSAIDSSAAELESAAQNIWSQILGAIKAAWQWVSDHVVMPLINGVKAVFQWVVDNVIMPIYSAVKAAFQWVVDNIISPLASIGQAAFQWVYDHIIGPLEAVAGVFAGFKIPSFSWPEIPKPNWSIEIPKPNWSISIDKPGWWPSSIGGLIPNGGQISSAGTVISNAWHNSGAAGVAGGAADTVSDLGNAISSWEKGGRVHNGRLYADAGTLVQGTDTVPAMLTAGEFVVNRHAVSRVGLPTLERINNGQKPGGGGVTMAPNITINTTSPVDQAFIRNNLVPTMLEAIKRASQNGKFVLAQSGIRSS